MLNKMIVVQHFANAEQNVERTIQQMVNMLTVYQSVEHVNHFLNSCSTFVEQLFNKCLTICWTCPTFVEQNVEQNAFVQHLLNSWGLICSRNLNNWFNHSWRGGGQPIGHHVAIGSTSFLLVPHHCYRFHFIPVEFTSFLWE